jgi:lipoprotein-anchoring transpeptidase ErfK/SrfK
MMGFVQRAPVMSSLRKLSFCYLVSASVFALAATVAAHPDLAPLLRGRADAISQAITEDILAPAASLARAQDLAFFDAPYVSARVEIDMGPRVEIAMAPPPAAAPAPAPAQTLILPDLPEEEARPLPPPPLPDVAMPDVPAATPPAFAIARADAPPARAPMPAQVSPNEAARLAQARLADSLTPEMLQHFELFLFVSKAKAGPVAQRMYVFTKDAAGNLSLRYDWAASTGREKPEVSAIGHHTVTTTPAGFYELDPERMYRAYHSTSWDQSMPYAMFFNWERRGLQTGLAIHAASGDDVARLGTRASAGCVHLSPQNAATLYNLIRADYRGAAPRFAYDSARHTMSNDGSFARDANGALKMADGYKVLIDIEDYGGAGDALAALY